MDDSTAARVVERVKELEHRGYQFEAADGSFDLLIRRETGEYEPLFRLESWRAIVEKREDGRVETEATIKIWVDGERYVRTAEGNGPVHALDRALRDAIGERYPHLRDIELVNFKVRILDERKGTGAVTRVLLDASDGHDTWGAIGVSENIIEASWEALVDSLEAGMLARQASFAKRPARPAAHDELRDPAGPAGGRASARSSSLLEALRSRRLSLGPRLGEFESAFGSLARNAAHVRRLERHRGPPPGRARRRHRGGRRGDHVAVLASSRPPTACSTRTRGPSSATSIRARSTSPPRPRVPRSPSAPPACCPSTSSVYPADMPGFEALAAERGLWLVEDTCEALGAAPRRRHARGRARQPVRVRLLSEQAAHDGRGRHGRLAGRRDEGAHRL